MRMRCVLSGCLGVLTLMLSAVINQAQETRRVDENALKDSGKTGEEWLNTGLNYAETRYSPLKQIDATNVSRLGLAWYYDTNSQPGAVEATPIISNGVLYGTLTWSTVFAVDTRTGKEKWRYEPQIGHQNFPAGSQNDPNRVRTGPTMCCGPVNRGVAIYDGRVYVGQLDGKLVALDAETGKVVWSVQTTDPNADYSITGAPRIIKGKVIIGNGGAEFAVRGYVSAYDAETGKLDWRFYIVPGDPSKPFENKAMEEAAKTWTGDWYKWGGGGTPWDSFAYDPDLDLLYVGTGNGGPWDRHWRSPGGGDNLYLSSIVALRPDTGEFVWYYQEVPGDQWDYTATQDIILADLKINGQTTPVLLHAPKNGFFYVIDRRNGKFISAYPFERVTWAIGIDQTTGRPIEASNARYDEKGSTLSPGPPGIHSWHAMSFNPETGLAYIPAQNNTFFYATDPNFKFVVGCYDLGIPFPCGGGAGGTPPPAGPNARPPVQPPAGLVPRFTPGFLAAWDPVAQEERWRITEMDGGGSVTTAGNLVFAASTDGRLVALSADKGEKLWTSPRLAPGFANPVTYMLDGKQYVSVLAGRIGHARLYTFALDGNATLPH